MNKINVSIGDFLKNAGIVGLKYLLDDLYAEEEVDYGITNDGQAIWMSREFVKNTNWTKLYFERFIERYEVLLSYQKVLNKINNILEKINEERGKSIDYKDDLKFINQKLLSNSYQTGFETIKQKIESAEIYEQLKTDKLKENMEIEKLHIRLLELKKFLEQPLCKETFSMKDIIYNYINRFWDGKSFLNRNYAKKDMREVFDIDFSEPLRKYAAIQKDKKIKDICIDCNEGIKTNEKISITFMKDSADDLKRKRSTFWNCKEDAYLCPMCAFIYSLVPLGFTLIGDTFVFINQNQSIGELWRANSRNNKFNRDSERAENEKYVSWIAKTINLILKEKTRELGNIQIITRKKDENARYTFNTIGKDILIILKDEKIKEDLNRLSKYPSVKIGKDWWNIHEDVVLNILRYYNQYTIINKLLKMAMEGENVLSRAEIVYNIQLRTNLLHKENNNKNIGGKLMNRYALRDEGYKLRNALLEAKGSNDDMCIRGTIYQLLNALSVGNVEYFLEVVMRVYCSTRFQIPNQFIEFLKDRNTFIEYGYAFLLGLKGSHYEKKEEKLND